MPRPPAATPATDCDDISSADALLARLAAHGGHIAASEGRWLLTQKGQAAATRRPRVALAAIDELRRKGRLAGRPGGGLQLLEQASAQAGRASDRRPPRPPEGEVAPAAGPIFNDAESPLAWLRARKGRDGRSLLSSEQFLAGERLRADYERGALGPCVTANWDMPASRGQGGPAPLTITDAAIAARQRYNAALDTVGEELASILVQVCCLAAGVEQAERILDLPQRSGRVVLSLGLTALARHYGFIAGRHAAVRSGHWAAGDYCPKIHPCTER